MRRIAVVAVLAGIWAMGPVFGSPSSLYVVPTVALGAALVAAGLGEAQGLALGSLVLMGAGWVLVGVAGGAQVVDRAGTGAGLVAIHGIAAALLVLLAWWLRGRVEPLVT